MERSELLGTSIVRESEDGYRWRLQFDDENQAHYYYNPHTGESRWADLGHNQHEEGEQYGAGEYYEEDYDFDEIDGNSVSNMSRMSTMSVVERSAQMMAQKREKQEALRQQLEQRELEAIRSGPEINQRSKQLNRNVDDIFAWEDKRKARMEALAAQVRAEEDAQITGRPHLYAQMGSGASVCSTNSVNSAGSDGLPVEARLMAYEEKRRLKLQQAIAHEKNEARKAATPTLAPHSANLNRRRAAQSSQSSVSDGQNDSVYSSYRASVATNNPQGIQKDDATGQIMFQPKINKRSEQMAAQSRPAIPVEDLLTGKGQLQKQRLQERERRQDQKAVLLSETRKVNPKSEKLVQERYILQGETTSDRLARPIGNVKAKVLDEIEQPTFRPTLNPTSVEIATASNGFYNLSAAYPRDSAREQGNVDDGAEEETFDRFDSMYYNDELSMDDGPLLYEDYLRSAGKKNRTAGGAGRGNVGRGGGRRGGDEGSLYDPSQSLAGLGAQPNIMYQKTQRWEEMRLAKLDKGRREREQQQAAECTFKPQIDPRSRNIAYENDNGNRDDGGANPLDSYLERQLSWVEKREQKLEIERQKAAQKEVEGCSFVPQLRSSASASYSAAKSSIPPTITSKGTNNSASGSSVGRNARPQGSLLAQTAGNKNSSRHAKWADEGPYFMDGSAAESGAEHEYENDVDQQVRAYYGEHGGAQAPFPSHAAPHQSRHYLDPETAEEQDERFAVNPLLEETPLRRVPIPQKAPAASTSNRNVVPAARFRNPADAEDKSTGDLKNHTAAPVTQHAEHNAPPDQQDAETDDAPPPPGRMKVPLPNKSAPPARIANSAPARPVVQPTTISVRVPASSSAHAQADYDDGDYVDYEPSPSSGVMLARSAPGNAHRRNVHFSAAWADQDTPNESDESPHHGSQRQHHATNSEISNYENAGEEEGEDNAYYNGLPFRVGAGVASRGVQDQDHFTPPRAGANQLFPSPPYQQSPECASLPYRAAPAPSAAQAQYSFAGLAEPEDHDYGNLSLFDVGQLDFRARSNPDAGAEDEDFVPPPPPPADVVEWTAPQQQYAPHSTGRAAAPPTRSGVAPSRATPTHPQYSHNGSSGGNGRMQSTYSIYSEQDDDYGNGMEFSPSPSKAAYDML